VHWDRIPNMRFERKPTAGVDVVAVIAMILALLAIVWARIEVFGTRDIEDALTGEVSSASASCNPLHAEALVRNRSVAGFTQ
jgi:hypothetical protein